MRFDAKSFTPNKLQMMMMIMMTRTRETCERENIGEPIYPSLAVSDTVIRKHTLYLASSMACLAGSWLLLS